MNEQGIPAPMLDAATEALYVRDGHDLTEKDRAPERGYWKESQWQAKAALEAAGVAALVQRVADAEQVITSRQAELNQARAQVAELEAARESVGVALFRGGYDTGWTTEEAVACIEEMAARIEAMESLIRTHNIAMAKAPAGAGGE